MILRGGKAPNYDAASVDAVCRQLSAARLPARLMIDVSHGNSSKRPENQPVVIADIAARIEAGERRISGVMVESHLEAGRQDLVPGKPLDYGQSITDGCIDWPTSVQILERLADAVAKRSSATADTLFFSTAAGAESLPMKSQRDYDLLVIGAGSGGVRAARVAAAHGARVAIAEEHLIGGTCVIRGCVPKKLLVYGAHFAEDLEDARRFGWHVQGRRSIGRRCGTTCSPRSRDSAAFTRRRWKLTKSRS